MPAVGDGPRPPVAPAAMGDLFWAAAALMLVFEGLMPFIAPRAWRDTFRRMTELSDGQIRFIGLGCMVAGMLVLAVVRSR